MPVYVITGVSKGIGYGFLKHLAPDPKNIIVGIVRDKAGTEKKVASELGECPNVHILHGDLTDYSSLKQAAADTEKIVGDEGVDVLIANAGFPSQFDAYDDIGGLGQWPEKIDEVSASLYQINVTGNIHLINLFMPLVMKGKIKKVFAISSGHGDLDLVNLAGIHTNALYGASKAALNIIMAKFSVQYKNDGVLFLSVSPGAIDVGHYDEVPPEKMAGMQEFMSRMATYAPYFKGPVPVDEAIPLLLSLFERASVQTGYAGAFVSQWGNKQWL
ncbi:Hypothetical protein R9X50_00191900 [Acrodontium crateriforme]|uniref:NAD(P)-binding protein n=1 Tax=Acrodontium crateriforme TaxID=150365 RepID=A0AAQ3M3A0_9PEZI|nr:Hypothetical protein R9X50_00191900 [Acrodontium crateriforme]